MNFEAESGALDDSVVLTRNSTDGILFDLDGVVTDTAALHARAWKLTFDAFLADRPDREGENHAPFDANGDYRGLVDGKPREDGIRDFLAARGIRLPEGDGEDPDRTTVAGLAKTKNQTFHRLLQEGVKVYPDAMAFLSRARDAGLHLGMVTSSRNAQEVLRAAGLQHSFEICADGNDLQSENLPGKPAPDIFLLAARRLGVTADRTVVLEDSTAGVEAGRTGGFAVVVGVARRRRESAGALRKAGADAVVANLDALQVEGAGADAGAHLPGALDCLPEISAQARDRRLAVFLDYDGTLTPIVDRPDWATLSEEMRASLAALAEVASLAIVSGRDLPDVEKLVGLSQVYYAGSHGFDISGPGGMRMQHERGLAAQPALRAAAQELQKALRSIDGVLVESKAFAVAVHYRLVAPGDVERVLAAVRAVADRHADLRLTGGKKIHELRPDIDWDKGRAVIWLLQALGLDDGRTLAIYLGDDVTDEDAFAALGDSGIGIRVGRPANTTQAHYVLPDTRAVGVFLKRLARLGASGKPKSGKEDNG